MISAIERAERLIGTNGLRKLQDAGIMVEYHMSFPAGSRKVIGIVRELDTGEKYPVIDVDPGQQGFLIIYASSHQRIYTEWCSANNVDEFEVI